MSGPVRVVITGAPGAGKSTLLDELARRGVATVAEAARQVLQSPGGMALRESEPAGFAQAMLRADIQAYDTCGAGLTVLDRGFPDIAGFLRIEGREPSAELVRICREKRYSGPIFRAPPWRDIYRRDAQRIQSWEDAVASDAAVCAAWRDFGYTLIDLPFADVGERAEFLIDRSER